MHQRRAVGGDVVGDELPEERPRRGDLGVRVFVDEVHAEASGRASTGPAERMQRGVVNPERRQLLEQRAVAPAVDERVDAFVARQ